MSYIPKKLRLMQISKIWRKISIDSGLAAEQEYGTSDLEKLREILETRRQENEMKVAQYEQHVKEIKEKLAAIEEPQSEGP